MRAVGVGRSCCLLGPCAPPSTPPQPPPVLSLLQGEPDAPSRPEREEAGDRTGPGAVSCGLPVGRVQRGARAHPSVRHLRALCRVHRPSTPGSSWHTWDPGRDVWKLRSRGSPPEDMRQRPEAFLVVTTQGGHTWHPAGGGQDVTTHPAAHRTVPIPQDDRPHVVGRARLEKPAPRKARSGRPAPGGRLWLFPPAFGPPISTVTVFPGPPTCVCALTHAHTRAHARDVALKGSPWHWD